jgi:crossover junction endodeoxyribonuclease RuvC
MTRILGVDLSLTHTGIAAIHPGRPVVTHAILSRPFRVDDLTHRSARMRFIASQIFGYAEQQFDAVVIEGPSYNSRDGKAFDRAGLWWMVVGRLTAREVPVIEVTPTAVKKYATGNGTAGKDQVLAAVIKRYPNIDIPGNNEADALVLAAMGARAYGQPIETSLPKTHQRQGTRRDRVHRGARPHPLQQPLQGDHRRRGTPAREAGGPR